MDNTTTLAWDSVCYRATAPSNMADTCSLMHHTITQWHCNDTNPSNFKSIFTRRKPLTGITEFDYFRNSYDKFKYVTVLPILITLKYFKNKCCRQESEDWLLDRMQRRQEKDEEKSETLRIEGNSHFKKNKYSDSCYYYTKSLCYANRDGVNYGLALANRSAALYYIGDFEVMFSIFTNFFLM